VGNPESRHLYRYFLALGSNIDDRETLLRRGWAMLEPLSSAMRLSRIYETRPMYVADQPLYLNAAGELRSRLSPRSMLEEIHRVERALGRDRAREIRMGPRTLDIDILLCDRILMETPELTIPHPRITERLFVLIPLLELAPRVRDPRTGLRYSRSRDALAAAAHTEGDGGVYLYRPQ
jgi:2-amino-4-hydroxy-6-hydroxymethyldihydropteridine diphosphokinase